MKKISYLLLTSCVCWVVGWTLLVTSLSDNSETEAIELTYKDIPIDGQLISYKEK